ncbi:MAG: isoprenylcysteine carboxylmethyltransferase family protein [Chlorobi bacterium]|nr:isoprenylcysteine carboxylmethyltransferase family protein [Chlorobiota bacterium]
MKYSRLFRILMWLLFIFGGAALAYTLDLRLFGRLYVWTPYHLLSAMTGFLLFQMLRRIARHTGRYLHDFGREGTLPRLETNRLVTTGYYALMRHPMHQGLMLGPFVFALLAGSPSFLFIVAPLEVLIIILLIIFYEEKEALKKFGDEYRAYMNRTPRFCFRPACWKALLTPPDEYLPKK